MKVALYAGSFDPWTFGHQFVLNSALEIFDCVHVVSAINPAKQSLLGAETRCQIIAHARDPFFDWGSKAPPFCIDDRVIVTAQEGLVAEYATKNNITHFIRGLRSTTDFESEFNLYFSNHAINAQLQTWAIMCPPRLLHCSATYVKTVVGKSRVPMVGTFFVAQAQMLNWYCPVGRVFDILNLFSLEPEKLQILFTHLFQDYKSISKKNVTELSQKTNQFLMEHGEKLKNDIQNKIKIEHEKETYL